MLDDEQYEALFKDYCRRWHPAVAAVEAQLAAHNLKGYAYARKVSVIQPGVSRKESPIGHP